MSRLAHGVSWSSPADEAGWHHPIRLGAGLVRVGIGIRSAVALEMTNLGGQENNRRSLIMSATRAKPCLPNRSPRF